MTPATPAPPATPVTPAAPVTRSRTSHRRAAVASLTLVASACFACTAPRVEAPSEALAQRQKVYGAQEDSGVERFMFEDFSSLSTETLETYAAPWKVTTTALMLYENDDAVPMTPAGVNQLLQRYGFIVPTSIANWDQKTPQPTWDRPIGILHGQLEAGFGTSIEVANNGCACCHAGVTYDATGNPTHDVWLGLPSSSLNLDAYGRDLFAAFSKLPKDDDSKYMEALKRIYPSTSDAEVRTIEKLVLPAIKKRLAKVAPAQGSFVAYSLGEPGLTNGVASIKLQLGMLKDGDGAKETAFTSIPLLAGRQMRSSLLSDGIYGVKGRPRFAKLTPADVTPAHLDQLGALAAVFTVSTLGVTQEVAHQNIDKTRDLFRWVTTTSPPRFPGVVDEEKAKRGRALFQEKRCQNCHGVYDNGKVLEYPNFLAPQSVIETDAVRWQSVTDDVMARFKLGPFVNEVDPGRSEGYVAPLLLGVWATAPYFHNGSVPTLYDVLHPATRPAKFLVGGHRLDLVKVGIDDDKADATKYPEGYTPWSRPMVYDTTKSGHGNHGHDGPFAKLSDDDKDALLEYLKTL